MTIQNRERIHTYIPQGATDIDIFSFEEKSPGVVIDIKEAEAL